MTDTFISRLHPSLRDRFANTAPPNDTLPLEERRKAILASIPATWESSVTETRSKRGLWYTPQEAKGMEAPPVLLWAHGGGFTTGAAHLERPFLTQLASYLGCIIMSVEYPLAPENPYPAAVDYCVEALNDVRTLFPNSLIAVGGVSAGGSIAAEVAAIATERKIPICLQLLMYAAMWPFVHAPRHRPWVNDPRTWNEAASRKSWDAYQPNVPTRTYSNEVLKALPSACFVVGSEDILAESTMACAKFYWEMGIKVDMCVFGGGYHSFEQHQPEARLGRKAFLYVFSILNDAFYPDAQVS